MLSVQFLKRAWDYCIEWQNYWFNVQFVHIIIPCIWTANRGTARFFLFSSAESKKINFIYFHSVDMQILFKHCHYWKIRIVCYHRRQVIATTIWSNLLLFSIRHKYLCRPPPLRRSNTGICFFVVVAFFYNNWAATRDFQQCGMCDQQSLKSACSLIRAFASRLNILWIYSYWLNIIWSF